MNIPNSQPKTVPRSLKVPPACHFAWAGSLDALKKYSTSMDADFCSPDIRGFSPLQYASSAGDSKMTAFLLDQGASEFYQDKELNTALHHAVISGVFDVVLHLVEHGTPLDVQNHKGQTPLLLAARSGSKKLCQYLIENGADLNVTDKEGRSALHYAVSDGFLDLANFLIQHGAYLNACDASKETPLHFAVREGDIRIVKLLVKLKGLDLNKGNDDGETPLHLAACFGELEIVNLLVHAGANYTLKNKFGRTPLQEALDSEQDEVVSLLAKIDKVGAGAAGDDVMDVDDFQPKDDCVFGMSLLP